MSPLGCTRFRGMCASGHAARRAGRGVAVVVVAFVVAVVGAVAVVVGIGVGVVVVGAAVALAGCGMIALRVGLDTRRRSWSGLELGSWAWVGSQPWDPWGYSRSRSRWGSLSRSRSGSRTRPRVMSSRRITSEKGQ